MDTMKRRAVFFDRDGTLNEEKNYLYRKEDWHWLPGAVEALARLHAAGYLLVVVSNQAGIARGYYTEADVIKLHNWVNCELKKQGIAIDAFYICPHHPQFSGPCTCRKPETGLFMQAAKGLKIDLSASWMIGDKAIDIIAGENAGCSSILVSTGYGSREQTLVKNTVPNVPGMLEAANLILSYCA